MTYTTHELQHNLKDIITKVLAGEEVIIRRRNERVQIIPLANSPFRDNPVAQLCAGGFKNIDDL